ncbi:hypothetical protein [Vibrio phage vB_VpaS_CHI]|nr:hypothetical protein [Vibrio phage vB_VpaS_ALK]USL90117.1 hypothetical protein [Vibrio phage vB_VpaS_CHI]
MVITIEHIRNVHFCSKGARYFCERHGLDWNEFIKNGLPEEVVLATGDHMAIEVVEAAWAAKRNKQ